MTATRLLSSYGSSKGVLEFLTHFFFHFWLKFLLINNDTMLGFGGRSEARLYSPTFKKDQTIFIALIDKTFKEGVISFLT